MKIAQLVRLIMVFFKKDIFYIEKDTDFKLSEASIDWFPNEIICYN